MKKKQQKRQILVEQMPGETREQYSAFLAYCGMVQRSLRGVYKRWTKIGQEFDDQGWELGKRPSFKTLGSWSKKYQWVIRAKKWDKERKELMTLEFQRSEKQRSIKVSRLFEKVSTSLLFQVNRSRPITVDDFKKAWEMFRTESGLTTNKMEVAHSINEEDQKPPTPEEDELGKEIDQAIKNYYDKKRRTPKK